MSIYYTRSISWYRLYGAQIQCRSPPRNDRGLKSNINKHKQRDNKQVLQVSPHEAEPNIPKYEYTRDDNPNRYPEMWAPSHCEINENSTVTWVKNGEGQARKAGVRLYGHDGGSPGLDIGHTGLHGAPEGYRRVHLKY